MDEGKVNAVTDVTEFVSDLDAGAFERMLSVAISQTAASVVDTGKQGEVNIKLKLKPIDGTHQLHVEHTLKYARPTADGKSQEEATRVTTMHVGKFGKVTLVPENQMQFWKKEPAPQ